MCGRFTREFTWEEVHDFLDLVFPGDCRAGDEAVTTLDPSWNVAPTQSVLVVRGRRPGDGGDGDGGDDPSDAAPLDAVVDLADWGFTPRWMREKDRRGPINARCETAASSPMFRSAFARGRCLVPMTSFYEWRAPEGGGRKQPWRFHRADGTILLVAGLRTPPSDEAPPTLAILTTDAGPDVAGIHDRMPVVLEPDAAVRWCDRGTDEDAAADLLRPAPEGVLDRHRVSTRVNRPTTNEPSLVEPVDEAPAG